MRPSRPVNMLMYIVNPQAILSDFYIWFNREFLRTESYQEAYLEFRVIIECFMKTRLPVTRIFPLPIIAWTLCDRKVLPSGVMNCTSLENYLSGAWIQWCDVIKLLSVLITWQVSNDLDFVCYYRIIVAFQEEGVVRFLAWTLILPYCKLEYFYGLEINLKLISLSKHRRCYFARFYWEYVDMRY